MSTCCITLRIPPLQNLKFRGARITEPIRPALKCFFFSDQSHQWNPYGKMQYSKMCIGYKTQCRNRLPYTNKAENICISKRNRQGEATGPTRCFEQGDGKIWSFATDIAYIYRHQTFLSTNPQTARMVSYDMTVTSLKVKAYYAPTNLPFVLQM